MTATQFVDPLRVTQLDAAFLDNELFELFKTQLAAAFKYTKPGLLANINPEINAALKLLLWKFSVHTDGATCGQQVVQLRYRSTAQGEGRSWMGRRQRLLYGLLAVGGAWLEERLDSITASVRHIKYAAQLIAATQNVWKVAALVNFLIFLMEGKYRFLVERLLHIRPVFEKPQGVRQVGFDYVYQEMLWQGIAEFLFVVLPLINVHRVKNFLHQRLLPRSLETEMEGRETDYKTCAVCGDWPRSPRQVGCQHVFCYYCVQSNYMADPGFRCPKCGTFIENTDQIQPVLVVSVV